MININQLKSQIYNTLHLKNTTKNIKEYAIEKYIICILETLALSPTGEITIPLSNYKLATHNVFIKSNAKKELKNLLKQLNDVGIKLNFKKDIFPELKKCDDIHIDVFLKSRYLNNSNYIVKLTDLKSQKELMNCKCVTSINYDQEYEMKMNPYNEQETLTLFDTKYSETSKTYDYMYHVDNDTPKLLKDSFVNMYIESLLEISESFRKSNIKVVQLPLKDDIVKVSKLLENTRNFEILSELVHTIQPISFMSEIAPKLLQLGIPSKEVEYTSNCKYIQLEL